MKKKLVTFIIAVALLATPIKADALTVEDLEGSGDCSNAIQTCRVIKAVADEKNGECWHFTIEGLQNSEEIVQCLTEMAELYKWELSTYLTDDGKFLVELKNNNHLIKKGETLWKIAKKYNTSVDAIVELNPQIVDPDLIYYDTYLKIPY